MQFAAPEPHPSAGHRNRLLLRGVESELPTRPKQGLAHTTSLRMVSLSCPAFLALALMFFPHVNLRSQIKHYPPAHLVPPLNWATWATASFFVGALHPSAEGTGGEYPQTL